MDWKKLWKALVHIHPALLTPLSLIALALLIVSAVMLEPVHPISILSYVLSFCALVLVCLRVPAMIRWIRRFCQENPYYLRFMSDVQLRMNISLYSAFAFNAIYALFQLCLGLWHRSTWFYAMSGYYLLLALMRLTLVRHTRQHAPGEDTALEWRKYRLCGVCLLVMNLALMIFTLYFVFHIRTFLHHEITTIAMAAYTFTSLTLAIINAVRYRRYGSPAYSAAKAISLASATVSMLTLENAMLTAFGQHESELFRQIILGISGTAVIFVVQGIALYMIINARRKLKIPASQASCNQYDHQEV